jgi:hypothetical protein
VAAHKLDDRVVAVVEANLHECWRAAYEEWGRLLAARVGLRLEPGGPTSGAGYRQTDIQSAKHSKRWRSAKKIALAGDV